jgi:hypothetical protein
MSARANSVKLMKVTKQFMLSWRQVQNYWRDQKSREFEKKHIESLPDDINAASKVIEEIDRILTRARKDCDQ